MRSVKGSSWFSNVDAGIGQRHGERLRAILSDEPFVIIDVGARGELYTLPGLRPFTRVIGFEPDTEECARLNALPIEAHGLRCLKILPIALAGVAGTMIFNVCRDPNVSSLLVPNPDMLSPFTVLGRDLAKDLEVVGTYSCDATTLDEVVAEQHLNNVDYIKLDTQGSELAILEGGDSTLRERVMMANIEVEFIEMYQEQPLFGDIDRRMRKLGFVLLDLNPLFTSTPKGITLEDAGRGQLIFSEALYVRDVLSPSAVFLEKSSLAARIKMILMLEAEGFLGHAIEVACRSAALDEENRDLFTSLAGAIPLRNRNHIPRITRRYRQSLLSWCDLVARKLYQFVPSRLRSLYRKSTAKRLYGTWILRRRLDDVDQQRAESRRKRE